MIAFLDAAHVNQKIQRDMLIGQNRSFLRIIFQIGFFLRLFSKTELNWKIVPQKTKASQIYRIINPNNELERGAMATSARGGGRSSFSRSPSPLSPSSHSLQQSRGVKVGPNGAAFVSSGIPDLDSKKRGRFLSLWTESREIRVKFYVLLSFFRDFGRWVSVGDSSDGDRGRRRPSSPSTTAKFHVTRDRASAAAVVRQPFEGAESVSWHASCSRLVVVVGLFF